MAGYNSAKFSKEFAERTKGNLDFITRVVKRDEKAIEFQDEFMRKYDGVIAELNELITLIREQAKEIGNDRKKGKDELKRRIFGIAGIIDDEKKTLQKKLKEITASKSIAGNHLYEVTQLLNSLMGICVLPYEMHKEYFTVIDEDNKSEANRNKELNSIQETVSGTTEYAELKKHIIKLYRDKKWKSTYAADADVYDNETIGFSFLRHMRNAACHSGDNAISILPLEDGNVIEEILFYDRVVDKKGILHEFAMWISIDELKELVEIISRFYMNTGIGENDKTKNIIAAENRVAELLGREKPNIEEE